MDGERLHRIAGEFALSLPGSELTHPFGEAWDVVKVRGKIFALLTELPRTGIPVVLLKADLQEGEALRGEYAFVSPGYHMNKRHWITLAPHDELDESLVEELVTASYLAVVAGLARRLRPVDPHTYGAGRAGEAP